MKKIILILITWFTTFSTSAMFPIVPVFVVSFQLGKGIFRQCAPDGSPVNWGQLNKKFKEGNGSFYNIRGVYFEDNCEYELDDNKNNIKLLKNVVGPSRCAEHCYNTFECETFTWKDEINECLLQSSMGQKIKPDIYSTRTICGHINHLNSMSSGHQSLPNLR